jgi:hypothetical protein
MVVPVIGEHFFIKNMNQPLKSQSAPKLSSSKRRTSADFAELLRLERAARRACFVPIPRAVARLMACNEPGAGEHAIELNNRHGVANAALPWENHGVSLGSLGEHATENHAPDARSVTLVVDQRLTMHFGSRTKTKSVVAAEIAAFIAWRALAQNTRVGALVFNDRKIDFLFPNSTRLSVMLILHAVLNQNHALAHNGTGSFSSDMLNRALRRIERTAKDECTIFLISDGSGHSEETRRLLAGISQRAHLYLLLIFDPRQKKFGKTRWLLSKRFIHDSKGRSGRDEAWLSLENGSRSQTFNSPSRPGKIPLIRFSTWESTVEHLRKAARKSILPPQDRPAQPLRQHRNGSENGKHKALNTSVSNDIATPLNGSLTPTQRYRPQL